MPVREKQISGVALTIPAGAMMAYGGIPGEADPGPTGWLYCDGKAVSRTTYADLFTAISTLYGVGDGETTFNVPDTRAKSIVGTNDGNLPNGVNGSFTTRNEGATGGAETHTISHPELPTTVHEPTTTINTVGSTGSTGWQGIAQSGAGDSHNNMAPFVVANYIIKT